MDVTTTRPLGRTKLRLTQLGFGGAPLGNLFAPIAEPEADALIAAAWDAGLRYFDTAPLYGFGLSEHRVGRFLRGQDRDAFVLSTKVGRINRPSTRRDPKWPGALPFEPVFDYGYDAVMRSFEDSLQRLGVDRVDILLIHDVDADSIGSAEAAERHYRSLFSGPKGGGYRALDDLRAQGVVSAIGAGLNLWEVCERLAGDGDFDCFLLAGRYTLLEQEALTSFLPLCRERNIGVIIGGPYNSGILATGPVDGATWNYDRAPAPVVEKVRRIQAVCRSHGVPIAAAALQFPLHHPQVASVIPGGRSVREMVQNIETLAVPIPAALWAALKDEGLMRQDAPTP